MKHVNRKNGAAWNSRQWFKGKIKPLLTLLFTGVLDDRLLGLLCRRYSLCKPQVNERVSLVFHGERHQINVRFHLGSHFHHKTVQTPPLLVQLGYSTRDVTARFLRQRFWLRGYLRGTTHSSLQSLQLATTPERSPISRAPAVIFDSRVTAARKPPLRSGGIARPSHPLNSASALVTLSAPPRFLPGPRMSSDSPASYQPAAVLRGHGSTTAYPRITSRGVPRGRFYKSLSVMSASYFNADARGTVAWQAPVEISHENDVAASLWQSPSGRLSGVSRRSLLPASFPLSSTRERRRSSISYRSPAQLGVLSQRHPQWSSLHFDTPRSPTGIANSLSEPFSFLSHTVQRDHQTRWNRPVPSLMHAFHSLSLSFAPSVRNPTAGEAQAHTAVREVPQMHYLKPDNSLSSGLSQVVQNLQQTLKRTTVTPVVHTPHVDVPRLTRQVYDQLERELRIEKERRGL